MSYKTILIILVNSHIKSIQFINKIAMQYMYSLFLKRKGLKVNENVKVIITYNFNIYEAIFTLVAECLGDVRSVLLSVMIFLQYNCAPTLL